MKNLTTGHPLKLIFFFALPLMFGNLLQQLYIMVDTMIVGRFVGVDALASIGGADWINWAILDGDITGPSIGRIFGVENKQVLSNGKEFTPVESSQGIKIMSTNLLLESNDTPVIWRGPVLAGMIKQFWSDVMWGDVDYMFVDMPPGTGDVPLTVFQSLPLDGIIIVTSPQELVGMIVSKAVNMAKKMDVDIIGIVENMSYVKYLLLFEKTHQTNQNDNFQHNLDQIIESIHYQ